ncbi:hypothetical protein FLP41_14430 [Paracoccus marcusii]|nr:hypothetical protein FLP41_14430 [Paracoccus marcusii]
MQNPDVEFGFQALDRLLSNARPLPVLHAHRQANDPVVLEEEIDRKPKASLTLFNTSSVGPISPFSSFERFACDTLSVRKALSDSIPRLPRNPQQVLIEIGGHQS